MTAIANPRAITRQQLIARVAAQRIALAEAMEPWRAPLAGVDLGLSVIRFFRQRPIGLLSGTALLYLVGAGRMGRWARRGWVAWQIVRSLRGPNSRAL